MSRAIAWHLSFIGAGLLWIAGPAWGAARPTPDDSLRLGPAAPIAEVRVDANADDVPDRRGETVTVAGRVTAGRGRLAVSRPQLVAVQDRTAGIHVRLPDGLVVERGDSLRVRGSLEHAYGLTRLRGAEGRVVEAGARTPAPLPLTVNTAAGEQHEGRLARVRGRIAGKGTNRGGDYLRLQAQGAASPAQVEVFVAERHGDRFGLDRFAEGDAVEVTGVVGQYDLEAPYDEYYQIEPRGRDDLAQVGWPSTYLRAALLILAGGGLVGGIVVIGLRAAVRRRTKELEERRARFRRLAEATLEGIALHEADGTIVDANASLAQMMETDREALIGKDITALLASAPSVHLDRAEGRTDAPVETELVHADGTTTPVEVETRTVTTGDEPVHVCAVRDLSKRKEWEDEMLRAKQEAEQAARLKSTLIHNMSHELRTPITTITGYAEVIMEEAEEPHRSFALQIRESGRRLSDTLQSVLDMAQIESGTLEVTVQEVAVPSVVRDVVDRHAQAVEEKALAVDLDVPEDCTVATDRTLLYRILNNLVQNAVKFTDDGTVRIRAEPVEFGVRIGVRDTGVGIAPAFRPDLFEPFKQESEGVAREYDGTGLGLALTKRLVDLLGGAIEVDSAKGEGSAFTVELPSLTEAEASAPAVAEGPMN
ncbi:sensor histidine kinase [Salinibacter sp.]|uniref:sensor histidine kinase n=1 Tax=Salinibacter sp. TaxID=2065818 RepID=UPI0021E82CAF|nr:PAS domain-containing sensor histidine kinase [Salinibacter sp.]